jgi:hypothetical protein
MKSEFGWRNFHGKAFESGKWDGENALITECVLENVLQRSFRSISRENSCEEKKKNSRALFFR